MGANRGEDGDLEIRVNSGVAVDEEAPAEEGEGR